ALLCECGTRAFVATGLDRALCPSCGKMIEREAPASEEPPAARPASDKRVIETAATLPALDAMTASGNVQRRSPARSGSMARRARWLLPLVAGVVIGGAVVAIVGYQMRDTDDPRPIASADAAVPGPVQL